jgi:hypothetical protein
MYSATSVAVVKAYSLPRYGYTPHVGPLVYQHSSQFDLLGY